MTNTPTPRVSAPETVDLEKLLENATPGRRVRFHGTFCKEAQDTPFTDWDSSHQTSVILPDGKRYCGYATHKHAKDAALDGLSNVLAAEVIALRAEITTLTASEEGAHMTLAVVIGERDAALAEVATLRESEARMRAERDRLQHSLDLEMVRPGRFPSCDCDNEDCVACSHYPELVYQAQKRIAARAALQGEQK